MEVLLIFTRRKPTIMPRLVRWDAEMRYTYEMVTYVHRIYIRIEMKFQKRCSTNIKCTKYIWNGHKIQFYALSSSAKCNRFSFHVDPFFIAQMFHIHLIKYNLVHYFTAWNCWFSFAFSILRPPPNCCISFFCCISSCSATSGAQNPFIL